MTLPLAYPDGELVMMAIHGPADNELIGTWIPDEPPKGTVVIQRIGGGPDPQDLTDYGLYRVLYYGDTRQEAMDLSRDGERLVMAHRGRCIRRPGHPANDTLIDDVAVDVNGTLDQDLDPDERRIVKNYIMGLRRQYHLVGS